MPAGRCKSCGSSFTAASREEYKDAPRWASECPACTKATFRKYLVEYATRVLSSRSLATVAGEYFAPPVDLGDPDSADAVVAGVERLVLGKHPVQAGSSPGTIGRSIAGFVARVDAIIDDHGFTPSKLGSRRGIVAVFVAGIALVVMAILLVILA